MSHTYQSRNCPEEQLIVHVAAHAVSRNSGNKDRREFPRQVEEGVDDAAEGVNDADAEGLLLVDQHRVRKKERNEDERLFKGVPYRSIARQRDDIRVVVVLCLEEGDVLALVFGVGPFGL